MAFDKDNDVLGQIFDFIFAQQEKSPEKRKPVDTTGVAGDKELIDAVATILENPAKFNVEHMVDNYSDAVNIKLAELRFSEDNIKKAEVGISNLSDILTDPVGYARKIRETNKAIRKSMSAKYLGTRSVEFVISAYLRKQGFSKELRDIIKHDTKFRDSIKELYEFSDYKEAQAYAQAVASPPMLSGADKEYFNARTAKLRAKLSMTESDWENLTESQKDRLNRSILENEMDKTPLEIRTTLRDILGQQDGDDVFNRYLINREKKYSILEESNLEREARHIKTNNYHNGKWDNEEAELVYERTNLAKDFIKNSQNLTFISGTKTFDILQNSRKYLGTIEDHISEIKEDLKKAKRVGDKKAQRILRERLKLTQATKRKIIQVNIFGNVGQIEGYFNSIKDYWDIPSIIKGDFFKSTKNQLMCPTSKVDFEWGDRKVADIMIPANQKKYGEKRNMEDAYNEFWTRVYYVTPGSIFRTFFYNGEGFAWRAHQQKRKIMEKLPHFNFEKFSKDKVYRESVLKGMGGITNETLLKMLDKYAKLGNLTEMFSLLYRTQQKALKFFNDKVFIATRQRIYDIIMSTKIFSKLKDGAVVTGLLKTWVHKGGLNNLFKGLSQGIAQVLGITAGPGLNFLIGAIVGWFSERLYDLAVPLFGVVVYAIFGIVGTLGLTFWIVRGNSIKYDISASAVPGNVGYCDMPDNGFERGDPEEKGTPIDVPVPINSSCPLGDSTFYCTQGFTDTTCSHKNMKDRKPVDLAPVTYFYAPQYCDEKTCTVSGNRDVRCTTTNGDGNVANVYVGQWVDFNDGNGNIFILGHSKYIPPSNGSNYKGGEPVAYFYQLPSELVADDSLGVTKLNPATGEATDYPGCWTGNHVHLLVRHNGTPVDPIALLYKMGCVNGPSSEAQCPACHAN